MKIPDKLRTFYKSTPAKITLTVLITLYALYSIFMYAPWNHFFSPLPFVLFLPLMYARIFAIFLIIPYTYTLSCLIVSFYDSIKRNKWFLITAFLVVFLFFGLDEPIVNNTINRPDYSCSIDTDCAVRTVSKGGCAGYKCVNEGWTYYDSMVNSAFALSCFQEIIVCSCVEQKCVSEDLSDSMNLSDCEMLEGYKKEECQILVSRNINRTK